MLSAAIRARGMSASAMLNTTISGEGAAFCRRVLLTLLPDQPGHDGVDREQGENAEHVVGKPLRLMLGQGDHQHDRQYHHAKVAQATVGSLSGSGFHSK